MTNAIMPSWSPLTRACLFAALYLVFAEAGHLLSFGTSQFATFWPPSGLYLAALLLTRRHAWPLLVCAALAANLLSDVLLHGKTLPVGLAFALGNTLEAVAGAWMLQHFVGVRFTLNRVTNVLALLALAAVLATALSASIGATLAAEGEGIWVAAWFVWWSGDALGILLVTPALLTLARARVDRLRSVSSWRGVEFALLLLGIIAVTVFVFGQPPASLFARPVMVLPFLLWAALRFGPQGSSLVIFIPSLVIAWNTAHGVGPFATADATAAHQTFAVQIALCVQSVSTLLLAALVREKRVAGHALQASEERNRRALDELQSTHARLQTTNQELLHEVAERQRAEEEVRQLSLSDELTGLRNRRGFFVLAEQGYQLARRTKLPCAILFADLDGLKQVNDEFGHDEGDAMIVAAASLLKTTFRTTDVVARLGGDEFAILTWGSGVDHHILPARLQAAVDQFNRPADHRYQLSLSVGCVACELESTASLEDWLARADQAMYAVKFARREAKAVRATRD